jgi:peptidyl-prolyl cis-trans isomerase C
MLTANIAFAQFGSKPIAVVNGQVIPRSELDGALNSRPQSASPVATAQQRQIHERMIAILIDEVLIRQFLAKNAPPVSPAEVDKQFSSLLESLKTQKKVLSDYCRETQQTEKQVRQGIESMLRWNAYVAKKLTDAELQKYYADNRDFFDKTTVRCSHIVYRVSEHATPTEREDAANKLRELRDQIVAKKYTFAEAAQRFSHCPSASKGGELGWIFRKWVVEEPFAKAAFSMKVGELSDVVVTDLGVHLIQVTDRKPGQPSDFAKIKEDIRDCCAEEMRGKLIGDLRAAAKIEINLP